MMFKCPHCLQKTFSFYSKYSLGTPHNPVETCSSCGKNVTKSVWLFTLILFLTWIPIASLTFVHQSILLTAGILIIDTVLIIMIFPLKKDK
jgi:hypothetical protein